MIDVELWRARIGRFNSARRVSAFRHGRPQASDSEVDVTLSDMIIATVFVLTFVKFLSVIKSNVTVMNSLWAHSAVQEHRVMTGTMADWETMFVEFDSQSQLKTAVHVPVVVSLCAVNAVLSVWKILLSNDVQVNPGPRGNPSTDNVENKEKSGSEASTAAENRTFTSEAVSEILAAIRLQSQQFQSQFEEQNKQLRQQGEEQSQQNKVIREQLHQIKHDLSIVSEKCEETNQRCNKLESENVRLRDKMEGIVVDLNDLYTESTEGREECARGSTMVEGLKDEVNRMNEEIDRLEEFSRRDNLRMFGVASISAGENEDYDACAGAVCEALNGVGGVRKWTEEDIVRAHRVGQGRAGEPKTMIVKFKRWKDKMLLIRDREFRDKLEERGVRVANDLTRRQANMVAMARSEGKVAFFVKGKLTIKPRRPDNITRMGMSQNVDIPTPTHPENHADHPSSLTPTRDSPSLVAGDVTLGDSQPQDQHVTDSSEKLPSHSSFSSRGTGRAKVTSCDRAPRRDSLARATDREDMVTTSDTEPEHVNISRAGRQSLGQRSSDGSTSTGRGRQQTAIDSYLGGQRSHVNKPHTGRGGRTSRSSTSRNK